METSLSFALMDSWLYPPDREGLALHEYILDDYLNGVTDGHEFKVNDYITLKLENGKTNIYVNDRLFKQCKYLLINLEQGKSYDEIDSIDEAAETLDRSLEYPEKSIFKINPETEFWGHCSNLQSWVECNYDTRLLHSNLAFPLLERLTKVGDPRAKEVFKKEIVKRVKSGYLPLIVYFCKKDYLRSFEKEELVEIKNALCSDSITYSDRVKTKALSLDSYKLGVVPEWVGKLTSLEKLGLSDNNLTYLPDNITNLTNLESLDLGWNKLESLPFNISELRNLKRLRLNCNDFKTLPDWVTELKSLKYLDLRANKLTDLPDKIIELKELRRLDLSYNQFKVLPEFIGELTKLEKLDLNYNSLKKLPNSISKLNYLIKLDLSHNIFDKIPKCITKLRKLKTVDLTYNDELDTYSKEPRSFRKLPSFKNKELKFAPTIHLDFVVSRRK